MIKTRLLRVTTEPYTLNTILKGQLEYMNGNGFDVHTASADGLAVEELILREGVPHHVIPFKTGFRPLRDLRCTWKLVRLIKKIKPTIVHTHSPKAGLLGMVAARICGIPHRFHTVATMPLTEKRGLTKSRMALSERITYGSATGIYPNSEQLKQYISNHIGDYEKKMKVIAKGSSNGIDLTHFAAHDEVREKAETLTKIWRLQQRVVFTFMGRITPKKGLHQLVDAFLALKAQNPAIKLLLIDPYERRPDPLDKTTEDKIAQDADIVSLGFQKDVRPYLLMTDVFVFPSHREGSPSELLQASAMGIPSITSDTNGCNEIIKHRITGLLVPPKNTKALTSAMAALAGSEAWRTTYGTKAREHVVNHYEQRYMWGALIGEYRRAVNGDR